MKLGFINFIKDQRKNQLNGTTKLQKSKTENSTLLKNQGNTDCDYYFFGRNLVLYEFLPIVPRLNKNDYFSVL